MSFLPVGMIGVSYKRASLPLRERFSRAAQKMESSFEYKEKYSIVIISTCNRTEIYFSGDCLSVIRDHLLRWLREQMQEPVEGWIYSCEEKECFVHLARVIAGLDSAIFAETEIQGQVRRAYGDAAKTRRLSSSLHYFFQKALHVAKGVRNAVSLEKEAKSLYEILWEIAQSYFLDVFSRRILFIGCSKINLGFISFLKHRGVSQFFLSSEHSSQMFLEGVVVEGRSLLRRWTEFDWVICAAKSETFLIQGAMQGRPLIFDLSVPRNVDPDLPGEGKLWNLEQIHHQVNRERNGWPIGKNAPEQMIQAHLSRLKFRMARESGERNDIANILHPCGK